MFVRYLNSLIKENKRLRGSHNGDRNAEATEDVGSRPASTIEPGCDVVGNLADYRNPLINERPWFAPGLLRTPIHVGEAAEAGFATRLRQAIAGSSECHILRTHFMDDMTLRNVELESFQLPGSAHAGFLINVAFNTVLRTYPVVRRSSLVGFENLLTSGPNQGQNVHLCRLYALLALAEAYAAHNSPHAAAFPGAALFARALAIISQPSERPQIEQVETYLLLVRPLLKACWMPC